DVAAELERRAGALAPALAARIRLHRELRVLAREIEPPSQEPERFGRFEILGLLGQGGLGRVFLARDPQLARKLALKVLELELLLDKDKRAWMLNEARALARIDHPGVVKVFEVGETATHAFVAMELLTGPSLEQVLQEWRRARDGGDGGGATHPEARALAA